MMHTKFLYSPPFLFRSFYKEVIWKSKTNKILLTFDDSPTIKNTEFILTKLNEYKIKSIFFCVGKEVEKYPSIIKEIQGEGHLIGSHSYEHEKISKKSEREFEEDIKRTDRIFNNLGINIKLFRPPYGRFNKSNISTLLKFNQQIIMWSLFTYDYKNKINIVRFAIEKYLNSNSIVVFHDKEKSKSIIGDSIDYFVETLNKKNFILGEPSECLI